MIDFDSPIVYMSNWFLGYFGFGYVLRNFTDLSTTLGLFVGLIILISYNKKDSERRGK